MKTLVNRYKAYRQKKQAQKAGKLPSRLPVGKSEFDEWCKTLAETYDLPTKDEDSIKFTLATIIMHLGPQDAYKPKEHFYHALVAGAAKQVAHSVFQEIKLKQVEAQKSAQQQPLVTSNESVKAL